MTPRRPWICPRRSRDSDSKCTWQKWGRSCPLTKRQTSRAWRLGLRNAGGERDHLLPNKRRLFCDVLLAIQAFECQEDSSLSSNELSRIPLYPSREAIASSFTSPEDFRVREDSIHYPNGDTYTVSSNEARVTFGCGVS